MRHGTALQSSGSSGAAAALPALRSLQKALTRLHEDLASTCEANLYSLQYLASLADGPQPRVEPAGSEEGEGEEEQQQEGGEGGSSEAGSSEEEEDSAGEESEEEDDGMAEA